jgi:hypothetical protein
LSSDHSPVLSSGPQHIERKRHKVFWNAQSTDSQLPNAEEKADTQDDLKSTLQQQT